MARSTRSSGKASEGARAKTAATVSKKKKMTSASMSSSPIASVSKRPSSSSKKAPATRRGGKSSSATATKTTTTKMKSPASSKKQTSTGKAKGKAPPSRSPPSSSTKPPPSRRRPPPSSSLSFPPPRRFLVGTALSVYQNSGGPDTNWSVFEGKRAWGGLRPAILGDTPCGRSSGFWDGHFDADAELARSVGSNCLRLSLEWSRVVPRPGVVDAAAVARYREIFDSLERRGMEVLVTLHHFVHPR